MMGRSTLRLAVSVQVPALKRERILKISRTRAGLAGEDGIREQHVSEATRYRTFDGWYAN
jgi:predicted ATPase with chaperone activity